MSSAYDAISMILVGALWGCTNPLLRHGAIETETSSKPEAADGFSWNYRLRGFFRQLMHVRVWLPYVVNQSGSLLYYVTLANCQIGLAVPICNALALVFSVVTSLMIGESMPRPLWTVLGASLVVAGVTICLVQEQNQQLQDSEGEGSGIQEEL